jgi:outer membrane murein-binding lipoprotein Lpp
VRISLNLASDPFHNDRPLIAATVSLAAVLTITLLIQGFLIASEHQQVSELRAEVERLEARSRKLAAEESGLRAQLQRAENAAVFEQSLFLNSLILPKSIAWTRLFADLEQVMPYNVRLISIRPQMNDRSEVFLDMVVASQAGAPVISFLRRIEESPVFSQVQVSSMAPPGQNDDTFKYRVTVSYDQRKL